MKSTYTNPNIIIDEIIIGRINSFTANESRSSSLYTERVWSIQEERVIERHEYIPGSNSRTIYLEFIEFDISKLKKILELDNFNLSHNLRDLNKLYDLSKEIKIVLTSEATQNIYTYRDFRFQSIGIIIEITENIIRTENAYGCYSCLEINKI